MSDEQTDKLIQDIENLNDWMVKGYLETMGPVRKQSQFMWESLLQELQGIEQEVDVYRERVAFALARLSQKSGVLPNYASPNRTVEHQQQQPAPIPEYRDRGYEQDWNDQLTDAITMPRVVQGGRR